MDAAVLVLLALLWRKELSSWLSEAIAEGIRRSGEIGDE